MGINKSDAPHFVVDHNNRNRLDCRKSNLRIVSYQQNGFNKGKQSNNTSGYPGVSWNKRQEAWEAYISFNRKKISLGKYLDKEDAIKARRNGEVKYYGYIVNRNNDKYTVYKNNNNTIKESNVI
jgi:hypothetical protein